MSFDDDAPEPRDVRAYCALARVDDDDPIHVLKRGDQVLGTCVDCTIVDGPFAGAQVAAKLCAPIGQSTPNLPEPGQIILLQLPHGHLDGPILATQVVPGGTGTPMPGAVAGIDVSNVETLGKSQLNAPPKGVGVRQYLRGAPFVIRLKGKQDDFAGEFYLEADDGTYVRVVWNKKTQSFGIKLRDSKGAFFQACDGKLSMQSPSGEAGVFVTDEGVSVVGPAVTVNGEKRTLIDGGVVGVNLGETPPTPGVNSGVVGAGGPATAPCKRVFFGVL